MSVFYIYIKYLVGYFLKIKNKNNTGSWRRPMFNSGLLTTDMMMMMKTNTPR